MFILTVGNTMRWVGGGGWGWWSTLCYIPYLRLKQMTILKKSVTLYVKLFIKFLNEQP